MSYEIMGAGIFGSPLRVVLRTLDLMEGNLESMVPVGGLLLAFLVLLGGWIGVQRGRVAAPGHGVPEADRPPLPGQMLAGRWKIPTTIYNHYDLPLAGFLIFFYCLPLFLEKGDASVGVPELLLTIMIQTFMMALVIGMVFFRMSPARWLGLKWPMWPLALPIGLLGVMATWVFLGVLDGLGFFQWMQEQLGGDGQQEVVKAFGEIDRPVVLGLLTFMAVVVAPVTEEVIFRGYLHPVAKRFAGRWAGIIFSALVFAVIHNNAQVVIPLFFLAVLLSLSYEWTGSIWAPIAMHMIFNGATVTAQLLAKYGIIELPAT